MPKLKLLKLFIFHLRLYQNESDGKQWPFFAILGWYFVTHHQYRNVNSAVWNGFPVALLSVDIHPGVYIHLLFGLIRLEIDDHGVILYIGLFPNSGNDAYFYCGYLREEKQLAAYFERI